MITLKHKEVRIRKPRKCFTCGDKYEPGDKMIYCVGVFDGDFGYEYYCPCCDVYIDKHTEPGDSWGEGDFRGEKHYEEFKKEYNDKIKMGCV